MFAVIDIPDFDLQAVVRTTSTPVGRPIVLVNEGGGNRQTRVIRMDNRARELAIKEGMTLAQALARSPELTVRTPSPSAEQLAASALLDVAWALAPRVEQSSPSRCTVDLAGLPLTNLESRGKALHTQLWKMGMWARVGFAQTPQLALYAARWASPVLVVDNRRDFLDKLPLELTDASPQLLETLHRWGLRHLGAFLKLSRQDVATRLGAEALALWDDASATEPRPLNLAHPAPRFEQELDFEHSVETLEPLLFILRRFLDQLCLRLENGQLAARVVTLTLRLDGQPPYERAFNVPEPTRDPERLFRMLHAHLEQVHTEAALTGLRLHIEPGAERTRQNGLFETSVRNPLRLADTLTELSGIAGPGNIGRPQPCDSHRPDAFTIEPLEQREEKAVQEKPAAYRKKHKGALPRQTGEPMFPNQTAALPLRRLRPEQAASVHTDEDGRPVYIESDLARGAIARAMGPWRLSGDWWEARAQWDRSEWDIELRKGGVYRIFESNREWRIEGEYG